jgi:hypothetical protein
MGRLAGRTGRVYIAVASGAEASPLPFIAKWSLNQTIDQPEVTAMEDSNKVYVSDMPDASGDCSGFYDDSTNQTYTAAQDGIARKFYLYPNHTVTTKYWFGTILPDYKVSGGVGQPIDYSFSWKAASNIIKVG